MILFPMRFNYAFVIYLPTDSAEEPYFLTCILIVHFQNRCSYNFIYILFTRLPWRFQLLNNLALPMLLHFTITI